MVGYSSVLRSSSSPGGRLTVALVAMRNLPIFSVSPVAVFAAAVGSGVVASRLAVGLLELPVRFFVRAMSSGVPRSSLSRSPLRLALLVLGVAVFFAWVCCTPLQCPRLTWRSTGARL